MQRTDINNAGLAIVEIVEVSDFVAYSLYQPLNSKHEHVCDRIKDVA